MASFDIHRAVADKFVAKNNNINISEFIDCTFCVDILGDKHVNHYSYFSNDDIYVDRLYKKVDLRKFCSENFLQNDYNRGVFYI